MPRTSAKALPLIDALLADWGGYLGEFCMELFIKGIRVWIPRWEQFYPRLMCKVVTH